ncbi:uncharacterized protein [Ptychodera flava]|uniref:uncharacterized protein n=1 Tax=Ptychodera flava TaxID=63121 RepID=UPI003969E536
MYRSLRQDELKSKIEKLQAIMPLSSLKAQYLLKNILEGKWFEYEFIVDSRLEYEDVSLICKPRRHYKLWLNEIVMISEDKEHLRYLLNQPGIIERQSDQGLVLRADLEMKDIVLEVSGLVRGGVNSFAEVLDAETMVLDAENSDIFNQRCNSLELPEDMTHSSIQLDDVDEVARTWQYGDPNGSAEYMDFIRTEVMNFPSICFRKNGELIAWTLQQFSGAIGNTYVKPSYRGRGLGRLVTAELAKEILKRGCIPYVDVAGENEASLRMHAAIGFRAVQTARKVYASSFKH